MAGRSIRVTGTVQGVGFRPFVWRLAQRYGLAGAVWNDGDGVAIQAWGTVASLDVFAHSLRREAPPLARIETVEQATLAAPPPAEALFRIVASSAGEVRTGVAADAATCPACLAEVFDPADRRYRYPFTNCTHCGPRLSIVRAVPYDRANTSMAGFSLCPACRAEYENPADRRFHAQPNACPVCGPQLWLEDGVGQRLVLAPGVDAIETAARLIAEGQIIAIKGVGGFHLVCDGGNAEVVERLRRHKHRDAKALALMARDLEMVKRYARVSEAEAALLRDSAASIVVLDRCGEALAPAIAPDQNSLGFMLPYTPLHHLLLCALERPVVMTSGNGSDEPQVISNEAARQHLAGMADLFLLHDRDIVNRLDDSVVRFADGQPRLLRRARGYAPEPLVLPPGFEQADEILAMGAELKNTFCLLKAGRAVLSPHIGDLKSVATQQDYRHTLTLYQQLFDLQPSRIVVDRHPDYFSTILGQTLAAADDISLDVVQHHHAHIAACMVDNGVPIDHGPLLGIALDGLGMGDDDTLWGGEFLLADYCRVERLAYFQPVPLLGGVQAMREPWRNTFAQLNGCLGWDWVERDYGELEIVRFLRTKPLNNLKIMAERALNSPLSTSAGRLFDAAAAAIGLCRERITYEGQAAIALESLAVGQFQSEADWGYRPEIRGDQLIWHTLWQALLEDLRQQVAPAVIAARFHQGVIAGVVALASVLCQRHGLSRVALGGGVFQNRLLLEGVSEGLRAKELAVFSPVRVPANDGGIALGQAAIAAARLRH